MNVGPIQHSAFQPDVHDSANQVRVPQPQHVRSENTPVRAIAKPQSSPPIPPFARDDVKVGLDSSNDHVRIYKFVKQDSGALVVQVPSDEVLQVSHVIEESLQQKSPPEGIVQPKAEAIVSAGVKINGN